MKCIKFFQHPYSYDYTYQFDFTNINNKEKLNKTYSEFFFREFPATNSIKLSSYILEGYDLTNGRKHLYYPIYVVLVDTKDANNPTHTLLGVCFGIEYYSYHWLRRGSNAIYNQQWHALIYHSLWGQLLGYTADSVLGSRHWCNRAKLLAASLKKESEPQKIFDLCFNEMNHIMQIPEINFKGDYFRVLSNILLTFMSVGNLKLLDQPSRDKLDLLEEKFALINKISNKIDAIPRSALNFFYPAHPDNVTIDRLKLLLHKTKTATSHQELINIHENQRENFVDDEVELKVMNKVASPS